jgi:hypothetical protein
MTGTAASRIGAFQVYWHDLVLGELKSIDPLVELV